MAARPAPRRRSSNARRPAGPDRRPQRGPPSPGCNVPDRLRAQLVHEPGGGEGPGTATSTRDGRDRSAGHGPQSRSAAARTIDDVRRTPPARAPSPVRPHSPRGDLLDVDAGTTPRDPRRGRTRSDFRILPRQYHGRRRAGLESRRQADRVHRRRAGRRRRPRRLNVAKGTSRRITTTGGRAPDMFHASRIADVTGYSEVVGQPRRGQLAAIRPDGSGRRGLTRKGGLAPPGRRTARKIASCARAP